MRLEVGGWAWLEVKGAWQGEKEEETTSPEEELEQGGIGGAFILAFFRIAYKTNQSLVANFLLSFSRSCVKKHMLGKGFSLLFPLFFSSSKIVLMQFGIDFWKWKEMYNHKSN